MIWQPEDDSVADIRSILAISKQKKVTDSQYQSGWRRNEEFRGIVKVVESISAYLAT